MCSLCKTGSAQELVRDGSCSLEQDFSHRLICKYASMTRLRYSGEVENLNNGKKQTAVYLIGREGGFFSEGVDLTGFRPNCIAVTWPGNFTSAQAVGFDGRDINFYLSADFTSLLSVMPGGSSGVSVLRYECDVEDAR